ncbi:branched-chain amino acid ABC transporter permease [Microbacterium pygmaeum]|uniref:Amino acid/amide ABC transporter membrane protein 2, HAAT family n=1 Tax=Microbacterium pygmaeum TaxID=370764 RepID=A0A1G7XDT6_9MICO|nr:branched-chain amino acid ABC transporter permease [Microbacterium pygmaeum]SDG82267.1 amino acid/amide ABC transporter membrane protein 2, HAAT family [Microbacterium pygmaeum]
MTTTTTELIKLHTGPTRAGMSRPVLFGLIAAVVALAVGLVLPLVISQNYWMTVLVDGATVSIVAISIGFLYRHLGLISLGQTAFYGMGAYAMAVLNVRVGWSLFPAAIGGIAAGIILAVFIGVLVMKAKGIAFLMLTLALSLAVYYIVVMEDMRPITGGYDGIILALSMDNSVLWISETDLLNDRVFWPLVWSILVILTFLLWWIGRTRFGTILHGIRENEERMRFSGFDTLAPRFSAFVIAGTVAAIAGVLAGLNGGLVTDQMLSFHTASQQLVGTIVGGLATVLGPIVGSFIFTILQSVFSSAGSMEFFMGLTLVIVLAFLRGGIVGGIEQFVRAMRKRLAKRRVGSK